MNIDRIFMIQSIKNQEAKSIDSALQLKDAEEVRLKYKASLRTRFEHMEFILALLFELETEDEEIFNTSIQTLMDLTSNNIRENPYYGLFEQPLRLNGFDFKEIRDFQKAKIIEEWVVRHITSGMCSICFHNSYPYIQRIKEGNKNLFYTNKAVHFSCNYMWKINGERLYSSKLDWTPERKGKHIFEIEYLENSSNKLVKKTMNLELDVI